MFSFTNFLTKQMSQSQRPCLSAQAPRERGVLSNDISLSVSADCVPNLPCFFVIAGDF